MTLSEQIQDDIKSNPVIVYMKGTKLMPMCGFSSTIVKILNSHSANYKAINILEDPNIRIELSKYSNWPTIPQLFLNGELIGGCDIAMELHNTGKLGDILNQANWEFLLLP